MAIGTPTQIATQSSQTNGQTSVALSIGTIANNTLVTIAYDNNAGHPTSVSDGTNTYTQRDAANRSTIVFSSIYSFFYVTGGTFTVTLTIPSTSMTETRAWSVSGIATSLAFDATGGGDAGLSGTAATTATGATTQADEIVFVNLGSANGGSNNITSWPPTTGYTTLGTQNNNVRNIDSGYAYKILSATETSSASDTLASSKEWAFTLATFKGAASGSNKTIAPDTGVSAAATVTATVVKTAVLAPTISGAATVTAAVVKTAVLTPTANATATVSGAVVKTAVLAPSVTATSTVSGSVVRTAVLLPSVSATSTVSGSVVKTAALAPTVNAVATVSVGVVATKILSATVNGTATVSATVVNTNAPVADTQPNVIAWQNYYH